MVLTIRWSLFLVGMIIFSMGIVLSINVQHLGIQAWDVLHVGLYERLGLSIGTWNIIVGFILIGTSWILDKRYIHIGTFINVFVIGMFVDFFLWLDFLPKASHTMTDVFNIVAGIAIMGLAGGMYNAGGVGSGPRDGFMLAISKRWNFPISRVRIITESGVLVIGFLIGGPVFLFSILFTFIQSPLFQFSFLTLSRFVYKIEMDQKNKQSPRYSE